MIPLKENEVTQSELDLLNAFRLGILPVMEFDRAWNQAEGMRQAEAFLAACASYAEEPVEESERTLEYFDKLSLRIHEMFLKSRQIVGRLSLKLDERARKEGRKRLAAEVDAREKSAQARVEELRSKQAAAKATPKASPLRLDPDEKTIRNMRKMFPHLGPEAIFGLVAPMNPSLTLAKVEATLAKLSK